MKKACENCSLYTPSTDNEGYCNFWMKNVCKKDYCVEYKFNYNIENKSS